MGAMSDFFVRGIQFDGVTGEKTGAELEDLATRLYPAASSQLVDQSTLETYSDATITHPDTGAAVNRLRIKDAGVTAAKLATDAKVPAKDVVYALRAYHSGGTPQTASDEDNVHMDAEDWDYGTVFDAVTNWRYLPAVNGIYQITVVVSATAVAAGEWLAAAIYKGTSAIDVAEEARGSRVEQGAVGVMTSVVTAEIVLNGSTQYVQPRIRCSTPMTIDAGRQKTWMTARLVARL